jgi:hypothetical protein
MMLAECCEFGEGENALPVDHFNGWDMRKTFLLCSVGGDERIRKDLGVHYCGPK